MNNWWENRFAESKRLMAFEDMVFRTYPTDPPDSKMPLSLSSNDEGMEFETIYNWVPWPQLIGYKLTVTSGDIRIYLSIEALIYYSPAFMLHWLYFRYRHSGVDDEIIELFIPPDDELVCDEFSGYSYRGDPNYYKCDIDRFYQFRDGMTLEQRKVCWEFCTLWVPWQCRDINFSEVEEAYNRLLSYWS